MLMGLIAKGINPSTPSGYLIHEWLYGEWTFEDCGYGMVASDLVDEISEALELQLEKVL